jgi:hypothetical protein
MNDEKQTKLIAAAHVKTNCISTSTNTTLHVKPEARHWPLACCSSGPQDLLKSSDCNHIPTLRMKALQLTMHNP